MIKIARKYKQVKRKELTFDLSDWEKIERRAEACHTDTTKYLRRMILDREPIFYDMKNVAPMITECGLSHATSIRSPKRQTKQTRSTLRTTKL